jgi:hypothetical protein
VCPVFSLAASAARYIEENTTAIRQGRLFSHLPHLASQTVYCEFMRRHTLARGFTGFFSNQPTTIGVLHEKSNAG